MPIFKKNNAIGLDALVSDMQDKIFSYLDNTWSQDISVYGRCYSLLDSDRNTIEWYLGNNEYENLAFAEGNKCFFVQSSDYQNTNNSFYNTNLDLFFTLNLDDIKDLQNRADTNIYADIEKILKKTVGVNIEEIIINRDRVFSGYDFKLTDDMQPYHVFKFALSVYDLDLNKKYCN